MFRAGSTAVKAGVPEVEACGVPGMISPSDGNCVVIIRPGDYEKQ